jgi:hypothetical protein
MAHQLDDVNEVISPGVAVAVVQTTFVGSSSLLGPSLGNDDIVSNAVGKGGNLNFV